MKILIIYSALLVVGVFSAENTPKVTDGTTNTVPATTAATRADSSDLTTAKTSQTLPTTATTNQRAASSDSTTDTTSQTVATTAATKQRADSTNETTQTVLATTTAIKQRSNSNSTETQTVSTTGETKQKVDLNDTTTQITGAVRTDLKTTSKQTLSSSLNTTQSTVPAQNSETTSEQLSFSSDPASPQNSEATPEQLFSSDTASTQILVETPDDIDTSVQQTTDIPTTPENTSDDVTTDNVTDIPTPDTTPDQDTTPNQDTTPDQDTTSDQLLYSTSTPTKKKQRSEQEINETYERMFTEIRMMKRTRSANATIDDILKSNTFLKGWNLYKEINGKKYKGKTAEALRMRIFLTNINVIEEHNVKFSEGLSTFKMGINEYADMRHDEFIKFMTGVRAGYKNFLKKIKRQQFPISTFIPPKSTTIPDTIDWRDEGAVTPVKNQKKCGSCWAFSSTGSLEGQLFRQTGKLVSLSEQNLVDCSFRYGNLGCNGGLMAFSYKYIFDNGGIASEAAYPYDAVMKKCRYKAASKAANVTGMMEIQPNNEAHLKIATATVGPISVGIDASTSNFQFYQSGVLNDEKCSSTKLNHAVLVVGYGSDPTGGDYWLVKNSWGDNWGDKGYIKMARNKKGQCGIAQMASYPLM